MIRQVPRRILVVDDDRMVRLVLHDTVKRMGAGYHVETAADGQEALAKLDAGSYDLMITDLRLPAPGGIELTRLVRRRELDMSGIWTTAHADDRTAAEAARLGVFRCLHKPLEIAQIRAAARAALQASNGRTASCGREHDGTD